MRIFTFLLLVVILACSPNRKFQTSSYDKLAPKHRKIAILPVTFEGKRFASKLSEEDKKILLEKENTFVQQAFYNRLARVTGSGKRDSKIQIESISRTNEKLSEKGIQLTEISKLSDADMRDILNVDAVVRIKVDAAIMLHSTTYDLPKEILSTVRFRITDPIIREAIELDIEPVFLNVEILDLKEMTPIWVYSKKRELEVHDKNTDLLRWLTDDVAKQFPYR
ncbi:MAG: hypothetical protein IPM42_12830 [Saprospiraceae bacterium]|jgi:hypothetical protein|nr:hypothetical protein [Saprospiraceae bacterium]